ncbi:MAG: 1-deoxy-D-xylulose-5-phosphate reductoisomerase, partial [Yoonia sp.]
MRRITIFGATGSVGQSALDLVVRNAEAYDVVALTGGRNVAQLAADARLLQADLAVTCYPECYNELKDLLSGTDVEVAAGPDAIAQAAARPVDWALSAIVGAAGLVPGLEALSHGTTLALANKESLVTAGPLLLGRAKAHGATVLPVDSEHSAVF